jgi:serine/threonine-protein kinase RsbW
VTLPALPACLDVVHDVVAALWAQAPDVTTRDRGRFETAVMEIAGNVLEHSHPQAGASSVTLTVAVVADSQTLRATLEDDGRAVLVDLDGARMPGVDAEDGRGLALARSLSDRLSYERMGATNRWTVECHRAEPS